MYHVEGDAKVELLDELELASGEDAPMSMASHPQRSEIVGGINSSEDALKSGPNQNCRVYSIQDNKCASNLSRVRACLIRHCRLSLSQTCSTLVLQAADDDYQVSLMAIACHANAHNRLESYCLLSQWESAGR